MANPSKCRSGRITGHTENGLAGALQSYLRTVWGNKLAKWLLDLSAVAQLTDGPSSRKLTASRPEKPLNCRHAAVRLATTSSPAAAFLCIAAMEAVFSIGESERMSSRAREREMGGRKSLAHCCKVYWPPTFVPGVQETPRSTWP